MILDILQYPHPTLAMVATAAEPGPETSLLLHSMIETLQATEGSIGLAAPQVGISIRAFVMGTQEQGFIAVLNPRIVKRSGIRVPSEEECLSIPGRKVTVKRSASVTIQATNAEGDPCRFTAKGKAACVIQHEMDHLDGIVI